MISLIIDFTLFFLVLFVGLPALMITAMLMRDALYQNRKHVDWEKQNPGKTAV